MKGEYNLIRLENISDPVPESCDLYPLKVKIPSAIAHTPEWRNYTHFAYCISFDINL